MIELRSQQVTGLLCNLKYVAWGYPGAHRHAWLQRPLIEKLVKVDQCIQEATAGAGHLLIWDALRSIETQRFIYQKQFATISASHPSLSADEIHVIVRGYVRSPSYEQPAPHTTGGAVDVTIWIHDTDKTLGLFDDFSDFGRAGYFETHAPVDESEEEVARLRSLLRNELFEQDFVGISEEWWHFEFGTRYWAHAKERSVLFDELVIPPEVDAISLGMPRTPVRQPVVCLGVAQVFPTHETRAKSLRGEIQGSYYARTRHPNERQAAALLSPMVGAEDITFLPSGLSAAVTAIHALMPPKGTILLDNATYYETQTSIKEMADELNWTVLEADLSSADEIRSILISDVAVVFCDHPRNWLLDCPNLPLLSSISRSVGSKLIVDTSVQPMQRLIQLGLADMQVLSLSKYPSVGETVAGAIGGKVTLMDSVRRICRRYGLVLAPEAAGTLLSHLRTMPMRMSSLSEKAKLIVCALNNIPFVQDVRIPNLCHVDAEVGGQLSFRIEQQLAERSEEIISTMTLDEHFPLSLGCTFGAHYTTYEHFDSRNSSVCQPSIDAEYIGPGCVRLGIGYEPVDEIISALRFILYAAWSNCHS